MQKKKNENRNRRLRLEKEMRDGFTRAHTALREIHKDKLYEPEYRSFAEYALAVWGYSKGYAHRLLNYADFLEESPNGDLKSHLSEGAYRPLERLHDPAQKKQAVEKLTEFIKIGAAITEQVTDQIAREIMPPSVAGPRAIEVDVEMFAVQAGYLSAKVKETLGKIDAAAAAGNALNGLNGVLELAHTVGGLILEIVDTKDEEKAKRLLT